MNFAERIYESDNGDIYRRCVEAGRTFCRSQHASLQAAARLEGALVLGLAWLVLLGVARWLGRK